MSMNGKLVMRSIPLDDTITRDDERTIPFLRRLVDMLLENEPAIQFYPGIRKQNGQTTVGRIVVHDRNRVEREILPRYFNHSSFASLRRQLNYFSFSRLGKDRQHGATYLNEHVVDISDILNLKRRAIGSVIPNHAALPPAKTDKKSDTGNKDNFKGRSKGESPLARVLLRKRNKKSRRVIDSIVPVVHIHRSKSRKRSKEKEDVTNDDNNQGELKRYDKKISPALISEGMESTNRIGSSTRLTFLDLTVPIDERSMNNTTSDTPPESLVFSGTFFHSVSNNSLDFHGQESYLTDKPKEIPLYRPPKDEDVLAGCKALLALGFD